jgi:hypothetical protein
MKQAVFQIRGQPWRDAGWQIADSVEGQRSDKPVAR